MGKSRKNHNSSFERDKDRDAYYDDPYTQHNKEHTKGQKSSRGHRNTKSRDEPPSEYIGWDAL
jgi:hypothetical protein